MIDSKTKWTYVTTREPGKPPVHNLPDYNKPVFLIIEDGPHRLMVKEGCLVCQDHNGYNWRVYAWEDKIHDGSSPKVRAWAKPPAFDQSELGIFQVDN